MTEFSPENVRLALKERIHCSFASIESQNEISWNSLVGEGILKNRSFSMLEDVSAKQTTATNRRKYFLRLFVCEGEREALVSGERRPLANGDRVPPSFDNATESFIYSCLRLTFSAPLPFSAVGRLSFCFLFVQRDQRPQPVYAGLEFEFELFRFRTFCHPLDIVLL